MVGTGENDQALGQRRTTLVSIGVAAALVAIKLGVGLVTGSLGLVSIGIESSGDVVAAVLTFFAVRLGGRPADRGHPYGHRRAENLGALGESAILLAGGVLVSVEAIRHLLAGGQAPSIHWYQFAVIALALVLDLSRTGVSLAAARRYGSPALRSNAFHFAADMAGSLTVLAGLLAVRAGMPQGDSVAALIVAAIIFLAAIRLIAENANVLMDRSPAQARAAAERAIAGLGDDVELSRLRLVDGDPFVVETLYLPADCGESLPLDRLEHEVVYDLLRETCGLDVTHADETLRPVVLEQPEASLLGLSLGEPAFLVERRGYAGAAPVELRRSVIRGDRYRFRVRLEGHTLTTPPA